MHPQDVGVGAADVGGVGHQAEDPVGLRVHDGDGAVTGHRQHAVAHAGDHVPEEAVSDGHGRRAAVGGLFRQPSDPSLLCHQRVAVLRRVQKMPGPGAVVFTPRQGARPMPG